MAGLLRIPARFYWDHMDRFSAGPFPVRRTERHIWIRPNDPHLPDLLSDARYYADPAAQDHDFGARALLRAVAQQGGAR